jgi:hypothetical protein
MTQEPYYWYYRCPAAGGALTRIDFIRLTDELRYRRSAFVFHPGSRCRMWVPPETKDPIVYHHPTRKSVGYFAAVRLRDGEFLFRRETGRFNGETFWEFLKVFREASAVPGRRVLAISDNAQYHRSKLHLGWRSQQTPQFGLDFLPPYSPELNPIERVWKRSRRREKVGADEGRV